MSSTEGPSQAGHHPWVVENHSASAARLTAILAEHHDLLRGLAYLRGLGAVADGVVVAGLALPELRGLRLGWLLWEALADADGVDVDVLLAEHISAVELARARLALCGPL